MKLLTTYELLNVGSHATISYKAIKYLLYEDWDGLNTSAMPRLAMALATNKGSLPSEKYIH